MVSVQTEELKCPHCGHEWVPRNPVVDLCPQCKKEIDKKVEVRKITCDRCGHKWVPRGDEVYFCPKCESLLERTGYNVEKVSKQTAKAKG